MLKKESKHWSNYWQGGQLTSLPQDFKNNYNGEIHKEWKGSFSRLNPNSQILDLCTGNCAISLLAANYSKEFNLDLSITAVDAANITKDNILQKNPSEESSLSMINLIINTKIEEIDLSAETFDLITSQYGIEYCSWSVAAEQVYRLLKLGGEFTMISHAGSTEIVNYMQIEKSDYEIIQHLSLFKYLTRYINNKLSYRNFMVRLNKIQPSIVKVYQNKPSLLLKNTLIFLDNIHSLDKNKLNQTKVGLSNYCMQHDFAFRRLNDLLKVTEAISLNPNWYKEFSKQGLTLIEKRDIYHSNNIHSGILYTFKK